MADPDSAGDRPRRFYRTAEAGPLEGGFGVLLDGRPLRTPGGARFLVPNPALARLTAEEWAAQGETVDAAAMPLSRLAFTAIDRLPQARVRTAAEVARYAGSDLLCYFAEGPAKLVQRQERHWAPLLAWARDALDLRFERAAGVIHRPQPPQTLAKVESLALELDDFALAGVALAAGLFGSAILALGLQRGAIDAREAFSLSRLDEAFQEEQWGIDAEAAARTARMEVEADALGRWFAALR